MTNTLEELQDALDATEGIAFGSFMIEHPQEAQTIRTVLEVATAAQAAGLSKMETTTDTECLCCGGTDGKCLSKDAEQPAQTVVEVDGLSEAITLFEKDIFANSPNQLRTLLEAARAYLTLTKREGV